MAPLHHSVRPFLLFFLISSVGVWGLVIAGIQSSLSGIFIFLFLFFDKLLE